MNSGNSEELLILWTTAERETVDNMVFLYTLNCKLRGWWEDVTLLVWGAATKLVAEDKSIQESLKAFREKGIRTVACKKCAENLDAVEALENFGIEVFYTGEFLTEWMKSGKAMISV
ncbi:MAG: DsrE family protein [Thermovirgaceae bacterium]